MSSMNEFEKVEAERLKKGFLGRNRVVITFVTSLLVLHIGWYKLVDTYVPEEDKGKWGPYNMLRKLDPFKKVEAQK